MSNELSELFGVPSTEASTLAGETAKFQQEQQGQQVPGGNDAPTFGAPSDPNPLGLSDRSFDPEAGQGAGGEPAAAPQQEQQQTPADPARPPMYVPNDRLTQEADRRRQAEERNRALEKQHDLLDNRLSILQATMQEAQQERLAAAQRAEPPKMEEDLEGYVKFKEQEWKQENQGLRQELNEIKRDKEYSAAVSGINQRAQADKMAFEQKNPDFMQGYSYWRNSQMAELDALGVPPAQATKHLDTMELQLSHAAHQRGMNSAEAFYKAALTRGYRTPQLQGSAPAAPAQSDYQQPAQQQNITPIAQHPQYQQPAPPYQQQPNGYQPQAPHAQSLQALQTGMQQNRSLDQAPPGASMVPMDLKQIANMSEADFMQHHDMIKQKMRAAMG